VCPWAVHAALVPSGGAGGRVVERNATRAQHSQTCLCGTVKTKHLSARWHQCACGVAALRELFSAYLARWVHPEPSVLDVGQARAA
jgi:putative transposase